MRFSHSWIVCHYKCSLFFSRYNLYSSLEYRHQPTVWIVGMRETITSSNSISRIRIFSFYIYISLPLPFYFFFLITILGCRKQISLTIWFNNIPKLGNIKKFIVPYQVSQLTHFSTFKWIRWRVTDLTQLFTASHSSLS